MMFPIFLVVCYLATQSKPVLGSIGIVSKGLTASSLPNDIDRIARYGAQRTIVIHNQADDRIRIWCSSRDDTTGEKRLTKGESMRFSFKPLVIGGYTVYWCTLEYKGFWARWDAFGKQAPYPRSQKNRQFYPYEVRNDGVYYNGQKFRGLRSSLHKYQLWQNYDNDKIPYGTSLPGSVDRGMCNNLPGWMEDKVSSVTMCYGSCITLYSELHCQGQTSRLQSPESGCTSFWLTFFNNKAKSLKGC